MSAGKVLALIVVVASFAIVAFAVSWCCWCVRSRCGAADKSIQAAKSVATVADTMDSSRPARGSVSSSLANAKTTNRGTSEPRLLIPAADVGPARASLPPYGNAVFQSIDSVPSTPTPIPSPRKASLVKRSPDSPPQRRYEEELFRRPAPGDNVRQRRSSKLDLLSRETSQVPSAITTPSKSPTVRKAEVDVKEIPAARDTKIDACVKEKAPTPLDDESLTAGISSRKDVADDKFSKSMTGSFRGTLATGGEPVVAECDTLGGDAATRTAERPSPSPLTASGHGTSPMRFSQGSSKITSDGVVPTSGAAKQLESSHIQDTPEGVGSASKAGQISTTAERKSVQDPTGSIDTTSLTKASDDSPGFHTPAGPAEAEGSKSPRTPQQTKKKVPLSEFSWAGKRSLLRKAQKLSGSASPKKADGTPEVSIVINVPRKEMSLLEVTKEHMLANANHCPPTAKKESI